MNNNRLILNEVFDAFQMLAGGNIVSLYDTSERVTRFSQQAVSLFNLPSEYISDGAYNWTDYIHPDDRHIYTSAMKDLLEGRTLSYDLYYRVLTADGNYIMFRFVGASIKINDEVKLIGGMMLNEGVTEQIDSVTLLRNQSTLQKDLSLMMKQEQKFSVMLIGIKKFSTINAENGYGFGNKILQQVAWVIQENLPEAAAVYRYSGAKFVVVNRNIDDELMKNVFEKIKNALLSGVVIDDIKRTITISGGLYNVYDPFVDVKTIFDVLGYIYNEEKTKKAGELYINANKSSVMHLALINKIRVSILNDCEGFYLEYQPVYDYKSNKIVSLEALLRWRDQDGSVIYPNEFIPVLENDYVFEELSLWIYRNVMQDALEFLKINPHVLIDINICSSEMKNELFVDFITQTANEIGFPLKNLCIELNKDCRLLDFDFLKEKVDELKSFGIKTCLDDFGIGVSSVELLKIIKMNYVKLNNDLVDDIKTNVDYKTDVIKLAELAKTHADNVCVKGIENKKIIDVLYSDVIDLMQGDYLNKPADAEEIKKLLKE